MTLLNSLIQNFFTFPRQTKRIIQVISDIALIIICFWMAMALRLDGIFTEIKPKSWATLTIVIPTTVFIFARLGLYRAIVRYMKDRAVMVVLLGSGISSAALFVTSEYFLLEVPRSVPVIYFTLLVLATGGARFIMRSLHIMAKDASRAPVAIYGAGESGRLLMQTLLESRNYRPAFFIDDDPRLQGTEIAGMPVFRLDEAKTKIVKDGLKTALIAIDEHNDEGRRQAALNMNKLGLEVRMIPRLSDLVSGRIRISALPHLTIAELLGRDVVEADPTLLVNTIRGRSVMVTGAGGSIGSELCRQILRQAPRRLVLFDVSEYALYLIFEELKDTKKAQKHDVELVSVLGSVTRQETIKDTISDNAVETLFHAAAYKHVPLVEDNPTEAVRNNSLGTLLTAQAAGLLGVQYFVLISTDKAVRPSNIMGATKRLAELAVSHMAKAYPSTKFCAVRFGNVLGSSGSIVPKFKRQILHGGPLTITHPDITRFFMTTHEAAQLVIQASSMANSAGVFVLDMGMPIRILDLAHAMCAIYGKQLHVDGTTDAPPHSIKLEIIGLRPGEKLHEELLINGAHEKTRHPKIMFEQPTVDADIDVSAAINQLLELRTTQEIAEGLSRLPLGYSAPQKH